MTCLDLLARSNPPLCDTASDYFRRGPTLAERRRKGLAPLQQGLQWRRMGSTWSPQDDDSQTSNGV
eukprot:CAMPEP_0177434022 /NCGR_PEP_ID=MMETSP0369-20130122/172_1 /TAXON_ID=447022 ORGANISM="Scrippsiella hangoei-like, Strain SHHI-4" /NCGR_SAMPLE_ID=MMETSP0369 /ASSEMBLY_ACC=CAM_ASM_000364 /LENGTH=65 /DNA_ID=CAMNT_0018904839 /DNA_START=619 /DNA_END=816 /DNA_ORIENTATION=-